MAKNSATMKIDEIAGERRPDYSIVIPVHNEQEVLGTLFVELARLRTALDGPSEVVFVDDGSVDDSWNILTRLAALDRSCVLVRLSRNFGHQIAVTAGLDHARGNAVVIMDADLQDPPAVVLEMSRRWREGYHVVFGVRTDRQHDTRFKRLTADAYYRVLDALSDVDIPSQVGDFRLIDRAVVDAIAEMPERNRYVRGMFAWLGFRQIGVEYARPARAAGTTSYSLTKMLRLASDGVIGYSKAPIRIVSALGACALAVGVVDVSVTRFARRDGLGSSSGRGQLTALAGLQLMALGLVGEYVARIFDETLDRPLYVTQEVRRSAVLSDDAVQVDRRQARSSNDNVHSIRDRNGSDQALAERR